MAQFRPAAWLLPALFVAPAALHAEPPDRGTQAVSYDIRDLAKRPERVAEIVQSIADLLEEPVGKPGPAGPSIIEILNGTRLVARTTAARHADVAQLLQSLRDRNDIVVFVKARLYEVDDAAHANLTAAKRLSLDELERRFLDGTMPKDNLFDALEEATPAVTGEEIKTDPGQEIALLSRYRAVRCGPGPEAFRRGDTTRQTVLEGIGFRAGIAVSSDRRAVRVKLTERAVDLAEVRKVRTWDAAGKEQMAEVPLLAERTQTRERELPDGGSLLVPVQARPAAKGRRWVLRIDARIHIEAEERRLREQDGPPRP